MQKSSDFRDTNAVVPKSYEINLFSKKLLMRKLRNFFAAKGIAEK